MVKVFAEDVAMQMGIELSQVTVVKGRSVDSLDTYLLRLVSGNREANTVMYQSEFDDLIDGQDYDRMELKLRFALSRLELLLRP